MPHLPRVSLVGLLLIAATVVTVPTADAQPPIAIVGARIVDGSGNEPFQGTVVMEGGRIRAVGRAVEVPAGAVTIDGAGRTVLPGLVDVRVRVEAAGPRGVDRSLAAALYSGVTTVALVGAAPNRFDALRAATGRPEVGSRVVLIGTVQGATSAEAAAAEWARVLRAGAHAISLPADAASGDSVAADARSRGLRVMAEAGDGVALDRLLSLEPSLIVGVPVLAGGAAAAAVLPQRNVTVSPDLVAVSAGRSVQSASLLGELSAAGASGATSETGDAARWTARVDTIRALREARVRLAVASDAGEPRLTPGWATHAAVRLLVDAGASALDAVTAATSGGAWAVGMQSDRGFLAPGMRADLLVVHGDPAASAADLERIDHVFLGGVEVDRPALLAKIRAFDAPPSTTAAPATATNAGEKARAAEPEKGKGGAASSRRRRDRRGATAPDAPPAVAEPPPAAATTTPPPAAPVAPEAPAPPGTPAAAAPVSRLEDPLIDDFERGKDGDALGSWSTGSNEGATPATIVMGRVVRGLRDHALHLTARMGEGSAPFVRVVIPLASSGGPVDVSRFRGLRFDARGEGRYRIVFVTRSIADGRYHESYFSGSPNWTPVGIPFASIGQNGSGGHAPFTGRDLIEIRFEVARGPGQLAWLELDNVRFY